MLSKIKIGPKLVGGFLLVSVIAVVIGIVGISKMKEIAVADVYLYEKATVPISHMGNVAMAFEMVMRDLRDLVKANEPARIEEEIAGIEKYRAEMTRGLDEFEKAMESDSEKELYSKMLEARKNIAADITALYVLARANRDEEAYALFESRLNRHSEEEEAIIKKLVAGCVQKGRQVSLGNTQKQEQASKILMIVMIGGVLLAVVIGIALTLTITSPLGQCVNSISELTRGNLLVTMDSKSLGNGDETGILMRAMRDMANKLKETITFALEASENVASGSEQLSSASQSISQGTSEQAASVEEISSSIEEMSSSIHQNADNASQTEKIAMKSSTDAKEGGEAVQRTVQAMKQIAEKISIIQEIARQTNLLSLNASIEAARAGEHGKGFAVVASAVQKLAERSQDAAEEISKLSKSSVDVAEKAGEMLSKLVPDIQKTAELVAEINASSSEQNKGAQQVNTAIQQFNQVVQSNASSAEELASTAEELSGQAEELKERLSFFKVGNNTVVREHRRNVNSHKSQSSQQKNTQKILPSSHSSEAKTSGLGSKGVSLDMSGDAEDGQFERA